MQTRLLIYKQDNSALFQLDLFTNEPIPLVYNADDFVNIAEKSSNHSNTFSLPGTKNNVKAFSHVFSINVSSVFNPHVRTACIIKQGTIEIFSGYLQLNEIVYKDDTHQYEVTVFSESTNFKDILGEKKLIDIDFNELSHEFSSTTHYNAATNGAVVCDANFATGSFAGTAGTNTTDVVAYPLVDYNSSGYYDTGTGQVKSPGTQTDHFRPWIKAWYVLNRRFEDAGYRYTSTFLDSATFKKLYVDLNHGQYEPAAGSFGQGVSEVITPTAASYAVNTYHNIDYTAFNNTGSILGAQYYDIAADRFDVSGDTDLALSVHLKPQWTGGGTKDFKIRFVSTGSTNPVFTNTIVYQKNNVVSGQQITYSTQNIGGFLGLMRFFAGSTVEIQIYHEASSSGGSSANVSYTAGTDNDTKIRMAVLTTGVSVQSLMIRGKGEVSQWEFFKSFIDMYNLVIMEDVNDTTNLLIEPYKDWVVSGTTRNWSHKFEMDEYKITPIDGLSRSILFRHQVDEDDLIYASMGNPVVNFFAVNFETGIEIVDNDVDEVTIPVFSNTLVQDYEGSTEHIAPMIRDIEDSYSFDNVMRVLYNHGKQTLATSSVEFKPGNMVNNYTLLTPASEHPITSTSESVDFNSVNYNYQGGGVVLDSLYNKYWSRYIDELYDSETRIVECKMLLTSIDINQHKFNDVYIVRSRKYRILKIEYKPGDFSKVTMVLIRDL